MRVSATNCSSCSSRPGPDRSSVRRATARRIATTAVLPGLRGQPARPTGLPSVRRDPHRDRDRRRPSRLVRPDRRRRARATVRAPGCSRRHRKSPGFGRRVHDVFGFGDSGASSQETEDRFAGYALGLLREVADGRVGRAQRDGAGDVRVARACQSREQGRLAGAVGADQTDHVAGRDCQVQPVEQGAFTAGGRQVADT